MTAHPSSGNPAEDKELDMANRNQHVVPRDDQWAVRGAGAKKDTEHFDRKQDAVDRAREIAQNQHSELVVHGQNGKIQYKDSHGHDTYPPKG
jgi:uncharacterized protein YdaT